MRLRCRGDRHRPGCAHLGNDPTRKLCRGDEHKPNCRHLNPAIRPVGRPRVNRRREAALRREAARRSAASSVLVVVDLATSDTKLPNPGPETDHDVLKTPPEIGPYQGTGGPSDKERPHRRCQACPTVEVTPGGRLANGSPSGLSVVSVYRAAHRLRDGIRPFGPTFSTPRELFRFLDDHDCARDEFVDWTEAA